MKNKGFTLIELLAVIIILGILMLIAIPSVTSYINNSRKSTYITTVDELVKGTIAKVNSGDISVYDTETTYYVPCTCIKLENGEAKSPYGKFDPAYVVVTFDGNNFNYYFTGKDVQNMGVPTLTSADILSKESIVANVEAIDTSIGVNGTTKVAIFNEDCSEIDETTPVSDTVSGEEGSSSGSGGSSSSSCKIEYPSGKDKTTVTVGEIVKVCNEEFYVVKHIESDLVLLAHYNLKVGDIYNSSFTKTGEYKSSDEGYGLQSSEAIGYNPGASTFNGTLTYSNTNYWNGKVGSTYPGSYCHANNYYVGKECPVVYDSNSNLYQYVNNYKTYLEGQGAKIKEARLLTFVEANELGCQYSCSSSQAFVRETSFWLGSPIDQFGIWRVKKESDFDDSTYSIGYLFGVRPVIVI